MKQTISPAREIRPVGPDHLEEYLEIYLNAYPAFKSLDADCVKYYRDKTRLDMTTDKDVDFYGMFEGERLIAQMKLVNFQMNVYGRMRPAVGLMALAVHPLFKKQGAALSMMRFYEKYTYEKGADIAVLLPFNIGFYRRMGYGLGGRMDEYHIATQNLPNCDDLSALKYLHKEDLPDVLACHRDFALANHGMLIKFEEEIREMEKDDVTRRVGCYDGDKLIGYAAYRYEETSETNFTLNRIVVDELIYRDGSVLRALLGFLRNQADLAQTIILRSGEEDFYHLLPNPMHISGGYIPYGYLQTNESAMGNMYKVLDPARFVENTAYRIFPDVERRVLFRYYDDLTDETSELTILFRGGRWSAVTAGDSPDAKAVSPDATVTCSIGDLSALLMNSGRLASFVRLGVMDIDNPEELPVLDYLLYYSQKPFSNSDF